MKSLRQFSAAVILTVAFALSASAGDMDTPITTPQVAGQMSTELTVTGDIPYGVTQLAVSLIQSLLTLS